MPDITASQIILSLKPGPVQEAARFYLSDPTLAIKGYGVFRGGMGHHIQGVYPYESVLLQAIEDWGGTDFLYVLVTPRRRFFGHRVLQVFPLDIRDKIYNPFRGDTGSVC